MSAECHRVLFLVTNLMVRRLRNTWKEASRKEAQSHREWDHCDTHLVVKCTLRPDDNDPIRRIDREARAVAITVS
jgi:hypothetical protein